MEFDKSLEMTNEGKIIMTISKELNFRKGTIDDVADFLKIITIDQKLSLDFINFLAVENESGDFVIIKARDSVEDSFDGMKLISNFDEINLNVSRSYIIENNTNNK